MDPKDVSEEEYDPTEDVEMELPEDVDVPPAEEGDDSLLAGPEE